MSWSSAVDAFVATALAWRNQHSFDIDLYQSSHIEWKNQRLHKCMIPLETFSVILFVAAILRQCFCWSDLQLHLVLVGIVGFGMGMISLVIMDPVHHPWAGIASFVFLVSAPWVSCAWVVQQPTPVSIKRCSKSPKSIAVIALTMWIVASSVQVVVGHWLWEQNSPDVLNSNQVSWLSLTHSVQIAWSQHFEGRNG